MKQLRTIPFNKLKPSMNYDCISIFDNEITHIEKVRMQEFIYNKRGVTFRGDRKRLNYLSLLEEDYYTPGYRFRYNL